MPDGQNNRVFTPTGLLFPTQTAQYLPLRGGGTHPVGRHRGMTEFRRDTEQRVRRSFVSDHDRARHESGDGDLRCLNRKIPAAQPDRVLEQLDREGIGDAPVDLIARGQRFSAVQPGGRGRPGGDEFPGRVQQVRLPPDLLHQPFNGQFDLTGTPVL